MQLNVKKLKVSILKVYRPVIFSHRMKHILKNITMNVKSNRLNRAKY